jgi:predicted dehydrogenase
VPAEAVLRIAVLGTAHIHLADHLAAIAADDRAEVCALVEDTATGAQAKAALATADAVLICSATDRHRDLLETAVAAGLPTLVEKPLAADPTGTAAAVELIRTAAAPVTTAMFLRHAPALLRVREQLAAGVLGELSGASLAFHHPGLPDGLFARDWAWMLDPARGGGSGFADLAIHLLDLLCWLSPGAALELRGAALHREPGPGREPAAARGLLPGFDAGGAALLDWGGVPTVVRAGWTARPGGVRLELEGTLGTLRLRAGEVHLATGATGNRSWAHRPPAAADALTGFLAAVRGEEPWAGPGPDELTLCARLLDAARRSAH